MNLDTDTFQKQLEEEKSRLEADLKTMGERNPDAPQDWNVKYPNLNIQTSDPEDVADQEEEYENRVPLEKSLEGRMEEIDAALGRIKSGSYGKCEVGGEEIPEARLQANPAARTCVEHADQ